MSCLFVQETLWRKIRKQETSDAPNEDAVQTPVKSRMVEVAPAPPSVFIFSSPAQPLVRQPSRKYSWGDKENFVSTTVARDPSLKDDVFGEELSLRDGLSSVDQKQGGRTEMQYGL